MTRQSGSRKELTLKLVFEPRDDEVLGNNNCKKKNDTRFVQPTKTDRFVAVMMMVVSWSGRRDPWTVMHAVTVPTA